MLNDETLEHAGLFRPKYVAKVGKGKDALYFYTQEEYDRYLHRQEASSQAHQRAAERAEQAERQRRFEKAASEGAAVANAMRKEREKQPEPIHPSYYNVRRFDYVTGNAQRKDVRAAKKGYKQALRDAKRAEKSAAKLEKQLSNMTRFHPKYQETKQKLEEQKAIAKRKARLATSYQTQIMRAMDIYRKTSLPGIAQTKIELGMNKVSEMLKSIGSATIDAINPVIDVEPKK